jgi:hypothetical protein
MMGTDASTAGNNAWLTLDFGMSLFDLPKNSRANSIAISWPLIPMPRRGTASRVEVLTGKRELSMTMVRKLRERFHIPADLLIPPLRSSEIAA